MKRLAIAASIAVCLTAAPWAADFWTVKPYTAWSPKEARKLIEDSPWAAVVATPLPPGRPLPSPDDAAGGRGGRGGGGAGGRDGFGPDPRRVRVSISWRSALPVKQAIARIEIAGGMAPAEAEAFLSREETFYVIGLEGVPPQFARPGAGTTIESFLKRDGKPPIPAEQAASQPGRGQSTLLIAFPRTDPVVLEDRDVEFTAKWGAFEVKKKFKLKDMVFNGKLEL